jgi:CTP-dependent riboflavin kinase
MNVGEIVIQTMNQRDFQIKKVDLYIIEITCLSETNWDVNRLMVQIKNIDGTIVYPKITTIESRILIDFIDGIATNYQVLFI